MNVVFSWGQTHDNLDPIQKRKPQPTKIYMWNKIQIRPMLYNRDVQIHRSELTNLKRFHFTHFNVILLYSREERCNVHPGQYCYTRRGLSYWPWNWSLLAKPTIEKQRSGLIRYANL